MIDAWGDVVVKMTTNEAQRLREELEISCFAEFQDLLEALQELTR